MRVRHSSHGPRRRTVALFHLAFVRASIYLWRRCFRRRIFPGRNECNGASPIGNPQAGRIAAKVLCGL